MESLNLNCSNESSGPSRKGKSKKSKAYEYDTQNINMKKSFTKFDDLQKRNLIHVRSRDSKKAQELFRTTVDEQLDTCRQCKKPVYKMEEIILQFKTGMNIFHKTCLRCKDCNKQLKADSYNVHDGSLYCSMHFKLIFAPRVVYEEFTPRKAELIIRENQPMELPPDVARASDKPNLGLDELQQLNVRSKFKVFENVCNEQNNHLQERQDTAITLSKSIKTTLNKLHKLGIPNSESEKLDEINNIDNSITEDDMDMDLFCSRKDIEKERPVGLGEAMNDIRLKFEQGEVITKEERREERKQEIQSIRSRLFLGKQAKIKEMYQLAVAESEQGVSSVGKTPDINVIKPTQLIKDRFENGEVFNDKRVQSEETTCGMQADADVFESAISKASRSIFMELDANVSSHLSNKCIQNNRIQNNKVSNQNQMCQENTNVDVIKSDSKPQEVKVTTEELTERFKFFETYSPTENTKKKFRITPPREGVVMLPTLDSDTEGPVQSSLFNDNVLQKTKTTSKILSKFREIEEQKMNDKIKERNPKPMKCFTPPPESGNTFNRSDSEEETDSESGQNSDDDEKDFENVTPNISKDQSLCEAQNAARAKQLRAKFEKWQINEIERELNEGRVNVYSELISNEPIESAKKIRERFENMKSFDTHLENTPKTQINRFVVGVKK
ncbi:uncharacterized protein LOC108148311 isoform X1 [Drosophila elegans]|uniref:uncharacterized protein LOC108148311 isoform X1 n=1 Tax=Drosophila elegans TaxID=30023 RepID=UPI0007E7B351|nr:uncharacterized protein LOC108148311 isoform X1 [Drosophila elegans]XP_041564555.1 uncharacterized protein LOC108148311 isoform X1 [Drosophila elegans]